jgi:hypothetical protein
MAVEINAGLDGHLQNPVSMKTVCQELHRSGFFG